MMLQVTDWLYMAPGPGRKTGWQPIMNRSCVHVARRQMRLNCHLAGPVGLHVRRDQLKLTHELRPLSR